MYKVAHIIIGLNVGGAELMLKRLIIHSTQQSSEFEHSVVSLTDLGVIGPQLQQKGVNVYQLGMGSIQSVPKTFYKLQKLLKKIQPDVVQTWMYHADFLGGLAAKSIGVKNIIWGIRTTDVSQGASKLTVYLSKLCAKLSYIIPNTIICAAQVSKSYHIGIGYDKTKMIVIPNGFDLEALHATKEQGLAIRRQNDLSEKDMVIGSVGRFNPVKNQRLFVEMAAELVKDIPELKFMMVGRDNTAENKELMTWIKDYKLENNFRLLGQRSDIPQCLKAMDIFCLHSKTEGFPNVLVEALFLNLPCLSTDAGDSKIILQDNGYVVPADDLFKLTSSMKQLIKQVLSCDNFMNLNSRGYIIKNFSIDSISKKYEKVWREYV